MNDKRQKKKLELAFTEEGRSEAPRAPPEGTESFTANRVTAPPMPISTHETLLFLVVRCWKTLTTDCFEDNVVI
jgi:hypothetical protein